MLTGKAEKKEREKYLELFKKTRPTEDNIKSWLRGWSTPAVIEARRKK